MVISLHYYDNHNYTNRRQQPSVQYIPPVVIERYLNQWIETSIQGYGRVIAYVLDYNARTGMVSLFMYAPPYYQQQYIQVHHSDLVGIQPYLGDVPPRPGGRPPRPPHGGGHGPGHGPPGTGGGGFFPWFFKLFY
ncbi:hypothetical protein [Bacillus piscicola]|uniref:hypothetical protein n=1 Tax=Bacillus piscicola TaxID=1632684 RepID=UPI001F0994C3|nr:hypothetical protein [Bacillus piscicola]